MFNNELWTSKPPISRWSAGRRWCEWCYRYRHRRYDYERYEYALGQRDACCHRAKPSISQCSQRMLPCRKDFEPVRHVRFGSLADITARWPHVRFAPDSGHSSAEVGCSRSARSRRCRHQCQLSAMSGLHCEIRSQHLSLYRHARWLSASTAKTRNDRR
jgi:hypothetical protein